MDYLANLQFNPKDPTVMHIDLNSCFATIEQQANPLLRGKPVVVAAYKTPAGCILAASIEAKKLGIKGGMRVKDARQVYPAVIIMEPDPWKYRNVHLSLRHLLQKYTNNLHAKSIDEFVLDLDGFPSMRMGICNVAAEIKSRIRSEIGEWLSVSIGVAPNRYLAKVASGLHKPDGLDILDKNTYEKIYKNLSLMDLCGIKVNNTARLNKQGIFNVWDFYNVSPKTLQIAFHSVFGYYWYLRLHGWEVDDIESSRKSYGNSVALGQNLSTLEQLSPILMKLVEKMSRRMRLAGYSAAGVHLSLLYRDGNYWHKGVSLRQPLFSSGDIYRVALKLLTKSSCKNFVHTIAVSCFALTKEKNKQLNILENLDTKRNLYTALDSINDRWGDFVISPAKMVSIPDVVKDRIAFGGIKELEDFVCSS